MAIPVEESTGGETTSLFFSLIIASPNDTPPCLKHKGSFPIQSVEILIAVGNRPAAQRNAAAAVARGEVLVFLDSDSVPCRGYFEKLMRHIHCGHAVVGGPALLASSASSLQKAFQWLLANPCVTGPSAARYASKDLKRACGDAELILCNLAVPRRVFKISGGFDERLYPNEENEWLVRLQAMRTRCLYDPDMAITRPQRSSWREFLQTLFRYGVGRTQQSRSSRQWDLARHLPGIGILTWLTLLSIFPPAALWIGAAGWAIVSLAAAIARPSSKALPIALAAPLVPLLYGAGQMAGLFFPFRPVRNAEIRVIRVPKKK